MKILLVIIGLGMGGAEHVVSNLADELTKLGHKVKIAYLTGEVLVSPKNPDVELISIEMKGAKDFAKAYIKLRGLVKKFKPDVVHSHMLHANIISRLLRLSIHIPNIVSTAHNVDEGGKIPMLAYRLTDRLSNISTNVSEQAVGEFIKKGAVKAGRMIAIPNGINTNEFYFDYSFRKEKRAELFVEDKKLILCVGRLDKQKDYPNLFSAVSLLKDKRKDFKVVIAGDGPHKRSLRKLIESMDLQEHIVLLGIRRDIRELMSASDIFVLPSAWEGFGLVVAEAMACERYVIATDCGGVNEVVGQCGVLINKKDHIALADKLTQALDMSIEQRREIGKLARKHIINNYSLNTNVESYLKLYNNTNI